MKNQAILYIAILSIGSCLSSQALENQSAQRQNSANSALEVAITPQPAAGNVQISVGNSNGGNVHVQAKPSAPAQAKKWVVESKDKDNATLRVDPAQLGKQGGTITISVEP